ncbi:MAG: acetyltransferase [Bacteroidota bacterium]|nr:acetyltransferase [Bacteroidota bacterium]
MNIDPVFIFGAGAQGRVALDILRQSKHKGDIFFIDEDTTKKGNIINDCEVVGNIDYVKENFSKANVHVALGRPETRKLITEKCIEAGFVLQNIIHPSSVIMPSAKIGKGLFIGANAIINTDVTVFDHVIINNGVIIEHDAVIESYCTISPGACIGGRSHIRESSFIGSGAIVLARTTIGKHAIIGMGAVVNREVDDFTLAYGVPARQIKKIDNEFNWDKIL